MSKIVIYHPKWIVLMANLFHSTLCECQFEVYQGRSYQSNTAGQTHNTSGPKCKYLCVEDARCQSATVRMIQGQGMVCEIMYDAPSDIMVTVVDVHAVLYIRKGELYTLHVCIS